MQRGPGVEPLVRGLGDKAPKVKTSWLLVLNESDKFAAFSVFCELPNIIDFPNLGITYIMAVGARLLFLGETPT